MRISPSLVVLLSVACNGAKPSSPEPAAESDTDTDTDADADVDADTDTDTDPDIDPTGCSIEVVPAQTLFDDTTWSSDTCYVLQGPVFVSSRLTIEPGTTIRGDSGGALIVTRDGELWALGTESEPIVFTSNQPAGTRAPGDWGGVALLGDAPMNTGTAQPYGPVDPLNVQGDIGGPDEEHACGRLNYVQVHFAGEAVDTNVPMPGLTLAACGDRTEIDHVQVHNSREDALVILGGTVDIKHVVLTRPGDAALDYDLGWVGRGQFIIAQLDGIDHGSGVAEHAIEGDSKFTPLRAYNSQPRLHNFTLVGSNTDGSEQGILLRENTEGHFANHIVMGFKNAGVDIRDENSDDPPSLAYALDQRTSQNVFEGDLTLTHSLFFNNGPGVNGTTHGADEPTEQTVFEDTSTPELGDTAAATLVPGNDDWGFDEAAWLSEPAHANLLGQAAQMVDPYNVVAPNWTPLASSPAATGAVEAPVPSRGSIFFTTVTYLGAVEPGTTTPFYVGWTAFPEN